MLTATPAACDMESDDNSGERGDIHGQYDERVMSNDAVANEQ